MAQVRWLVLGIASALTFQTALAQIVRDFSKKTRPKYEFGMGFAAFDLPDYPGSESNQFRWLPFPFINYRGEYLRSDDEGTRAKLSASKFYELGLSLGFNFPVDSDHDSVRSGMPNLDAIVGLGPRLMFRFYSKDKIHKLNLTFGIETPFSVNNSATEFTNQGLIFEPALAYWRYLGKAKNSVFFANLKSQFGDSKYNDYFYSVEQKYRTNDRKEYSAKAGLVRNIATLGITYNFTPKFTLFTGAFYQDLNHAANKSSPLVVAKQNQGVLAGLFWLFAESKERVHIYK